MLIVLGPILNLKKLFILRRRKYDTRITYIILVAIVYSLRPKKKAIMSSGEKLLTFSHSSVLPVS
jgi:hypothetical protein